MIAMSSKTVKLKDNKGNLLSFYPIGSIYMSVIDVNPSEWFGGVWEQIKDVFLLGCSDTIPAGQTGGEKEHTLTIEEMPAHNHSLNTRINAAGFSSSNDLARAADGTTEWKQNELYMKKEGGDQPHNNMPPYLAVYIYKRIA